MTRRERVFLLVLILGSLGLRIAYHVEMSEAPLVEHLQLDEQYHDRWAQSIAEGNVIGEGVFFRAPLYPYMLGFLYAIVGHAPELMRILQHLAGTALIALLYLLARMLFGKTAAVISALLGSLYAVMISFEGRLLFDFPVTFLAMLWLVLAVHFSNSPSQSRYGVLGFLFGLICIMRPTFLPLSIPLFGLIVWNQEGDRKQALRRIASLGIAFLVPVLLVTARNMLVGGDTVLVASQGGINFYIGNNPSADGCTPSVPEAGGVAWENRHVEYIAEQALGHTPSPSEVSSYWYGRGWEFIRNDPLAAFTLLVKKAYLFWSHIELINNQSYYAFERSSKILSALPVGFWLVGTLGLAGAVVSWRNRRTRLLLIYLILYFVVTIAFFVCDRFRLPVVPVLCIFSGYLIHHVVEAVGSRRWFSLARTGVLVAACALLVNTNLADLRPEIEFGEDEVKALAALESGDFSTAADLFGQVALLNPGNSGARVNQGIALWRLGRISEAISAFHAGIGGDTYFALLNLAHLYFTLHRLDSVDVYADRTIEARPYAPGGYIIAARAFLARLDTKNAEKVLLKGREACGKDFVYGEFLLAGLYVQTGRRATADSIYREVLLKTANPTRTEYMLQSERARFGQDLGTVHAQTLHALGRLFAASGRLDSSEVYLRAATQRLPSRADMWADWGVCLMRLNRLDEAEEALRNAVGLSASNPVVWFNYATVLANKGELERAREAISQTLSLHPGFPEAIDLQKRLEARTPD